MANVPQPVTMDKPRERLARWMKDGSTLLTQLLDDLSRARTALTDLQRECATLREENDRYRKERSEVVQKITATLDTVSDTLLRFRDGSAASVVGQTTQPVAAVTVASPSETPVMAVLAVDDGPAPPAVGFETRSAAVPVPKGPRDPGAPHILVVDDDTSFRNMLSHYLSENGGYEVTTAVNGEEALTLLTNHQPQAVVLDLMMPGMGGLEALRRIKAEYPGLCVLTVTAFEDLGSAQDVLALGAVDYLKKPFKLEHLDALLNLHLSHPQPQPTLARG
jgi:CheY-like chemotaxis protein